MGDLYTDEKLDRRDIGELIEFLGKQLKFESEISLKDVDNYLEKLRMRKGLSNRFPMFSADSTIDRATQFIDELKTSDNIRDFIEIFYGIPVPAKVGRQILAKLAIGVILTSQGSLNDLKNRWEQREKKIDLLNPYQMPKERFKETLLDNELFPSGYSIVSFAKKYHIRLPLTKDKTTLIQLLVDQLFERPSDSKRIGNWGVDEKKAIKQ